MSGLDNLRTRMNYTGITTQDRYEKNKLWGLRRALKYAYQRETIVLNDGREFNALINSDKVKQNYDDKILSIPYKDICLNKPRVGKTTEGFEEVGIKPGDTFLWKETNTWWIAYMQELQETSYFKSEIRRCRHTVVFGDKEYHVYIDQPDIQQMIWTTKQDRFSWNDINYKLKMFVTRDETTSKYFTRFTKIKIDGDTWEVVSSNELSVEGLIVVFLREYFNNSIADAAVKEKLIKVKKELEPEAAYIQGDEKVYPYNIYTYYIQNMPADGVWSIDNKKDARILEQDNTKVVIEIIAGKSDIFNLFYTREDLETDNVSLEIKIESL